MSPRPSLIRSPGVSYADQIVSFWGQLTRIVTANAAAINTTRKTVLATLRPIGTPQFASGRIPYFVSSRIHDQPRSDRQSKKIHKYIAKMSGEFQICHADTRNGGGDLKQLSLGEKRRTTAQQTATVAIAFANVATTK